MSRDNNIYLLTRLLVEEGEYSFFPLPSTCIGTDMREILHVQVGQCGNQIGSKVCSFHNNNNDNNNNQPIAFENLGTLNSTAISLISAVGRNISTKSNDLRESTFLFQRLAITLQPFNSILLRESFVCDPDK